MTYNRKRSFRLAVLVLCIIISIGLFPAIEAAAEGSGHKIVREGWYESPFCHLESNGRRLGYAYEYQQKIAGYVDWEYEYVEGSWPELFEMLKNGEIDLLSDVSYTEERLSQMLFCQTAMGSELYYVFISPDNTDFVPGDINSLQGKKVGVNKGSYQMQLYKDWSEKNGIVSEIVELVSSESDSIDMLMSGELDACVSIDGFGMNDTCIPVFKIGQSDFYFAVRNSHYDLYEELNSAMSKIEDEDRSYNQKLYEKYVKICRRKYVPPEQ